LGGLGSKGAIFFHCASVSNGPDRAIGPPSALLTLLIPHFTKLNHSHFRGLSSVMQQLLTIAVTIGQSQTEPLHVSLIQLIANPEKYDGKQVAVVGFLRLEFEGNALYLFAGRLSPRDNKECNLDRRYARHRQGRPSS
jgi:hypothetical protein